MLSPGVLITAAAVILSLLLSGRPVKLVRWALLVSGALQFISFFSLPGVPDSGFPTLFLGLGISIGAYAGFRTKLQWKNKWVFYHQRLWIAVSYLLVMLLYQLTAAVTNSYFPLILLFFGATAGLQLGFGMALFCKRFFLKKPSLSTLGIVLAGLLISGTFLSAHNAYGYSAVHTFTIDEWNVRCEITSSYFFNGEMTQEALNNFPTASEILNAGGITIRPGEEEVAVVDIQKGNCLYHLEINTVGNVFAEGSQSYYDAITGPITVSYMNQGVGGVMEGGSRFAGNLKMSRPAVASAEASDSTTIEPEVSPSDSISDNSGNSPIIPIPLFDEDQRAAQESGVMTGIAGLISILTGLLPKGFHLDSGNRSSAIPPKSVTPPTSKTTPHANVKAESRATIGMRRADGQVYTKNHGWQNENFPNIQVNSLQSSVENLKEQIQSHRQKGDALRTQIAEDLLKEKQRELKRWREDSTTVSKTKSLQNEALYQGQSDRWKAQDECLERASGYAEKISFAADIGLAVATSGASTIYTSAKSFSTLKRAVKTIKTLSEAKEIVGMAASVTDSVVNKKKSIVGAVVEEAINAKVGKAAGDLYGKAFKSMGFTKVGSGVDDLTKALINSGNTYMTGVAQDSAKGVGFTGFVPEKIEKAEKYFNAVANRISTNTQGGR